MLTQELARKLFSYDPLTGIVTRKISIAYNACVGDVVGYISGRYLAVKINDIPYGLHRVIWIWMEGEIPEGLQVEHKDTNEYNNKWDNLRLATHTQNMYNKQIYKNNTTGYKGVHYRKSKDHYEVYIRVNKKSIYLGSFKDIEEAAKARTLGAIKYHGEFARDE